MDDIDNLLDEAEKAINKNTKTVKSTRNTANNLEIDDHVSRILEEIDDVAMIPAMSTSASPISRYSSDSSRTSSESHQCSPVIIGGSAVSLGLATFASKR